MGYYVDLNYEARRYAHLFLMEASSRFDGELSGVLTQAADHYKRIREAYQILNELYPWMQPHAPIEDPDRRRQAVDGLTRIKQLEVEGYIWLQRVKEACVRHQQSPSDQL